MRRIMIRIKQTCQKGLTLQARMMCTNSRYTKDTRVALPIPFDREELNDLGSPVNLQRIHKSSYELLGIIRNH